MDALLLVERLAPRPLRRQEVRRRAAKVAQDVAAVGGNQHILELHVAVLHRRVGAVHVDDGGGDLREDLEHAQRRQRRALLEGAALALFVDDVD